jgi:hypothetical protein
MRSKVVLFGLACLLICRSEGNSGEPQTGSPNLSGSLPAVSAMSYQTPTTPQTPQTPRAPQAQAPQQPSTDQFAQAPEAGTEAAETAAPQMMGDFQGLQTLFLSGSSHRVPVVTLGGFKIADNESPLAQDRVFVNYDFFDSVKGSGTPSFDVHRETIGFEKTFFESAASFGLRLPFFQTPGDGGVDRSGIGDLSAIFKYNLLANGDSGCCGNGGGNYGCGNHGCGHAQDALSTGLVITAPTGRDIRTSDGNINPTLIQPFVGFLRNSNGVFVEGFSSVVIPTESSLPVVLFNDLGVGYRYSLSQGDYVTAISPVLEAHLTTPLNHRGTSSSELITAPDIFVMTAGLHLDLSEYSRLSIGLAVPFTGPKPYDLETLTQLNIRF